MPTERDTTPTAGGAALDAMAEALRPFARVAEVDIGVDETDDDIFQQSNPNYAKAPRIKVGDLRRAAAILARLAERGTGSQAAPHSQTLEKGVSSEQAAPGCGRLREGVQEAIRCLEAIAGRMEKDGSPEIARGIDVGVSGLRRHLAALAQAGQDAEGWETIDTCPSKGEPVWIWGGWAAPLPQRRQADGEHWRRLRADGINAPTHWCHDRVPTPPAQPSGDAS